MSEWDAQYAESLEVLFSEYGETVSYVPEGGAAVSRTGLWQPDGMRVQAGRRRGGGEEFGVEEASEGTLVLWNDAETGVASVTEGDTVVMGGAGWRVTGCLTRGPAHQVRLARESQVKRSGGTQWVRR